MPTSTTASRFTSALILTLSLFALWGMGQQLCGVPLPQIAGPLHLTGLADVAGPLGNVFVWAALVFAAGRFAGCALMRVVSPARLLAIFAGGGILCQLVSSAWPALPAAIGMLLPAAGFALILGFAVIGGARTQRWTP